MIIDQVTAYKIHHQVPNMQICKKSSKLFGDLLLLRFESLDPPLKSKGIYMTTYFMHDSIVRPLKITNSYPWVSITQQLLKSST